RQVIKYFPNTTIYFVDNKCRFYEKYVREDFEFHRIAHVTKSNLLTSILNEAKSGQSFNQLVYFLTSRGIEYKNAEAYVFDLIRGQLLCSELEPLIIGDTYIEDVIKHLSPYKVIPPI